MSNVSASLPDWIQAVQALMILSLLFCFFSLIAFVYQLFRLVKGGRFFFTAIFQILASEYELIKKMAHTLLMSSHIPFDSPHLSACLSQVCL